MPRPSQSPSFYHFGSVWHAVETTQLLLRKFPPDPSKTLIVASVALLHFMKC
jgi:hypothetical protein